MHGRCLTIISTAKHKPAGSILIRTPEPRTHVGTSRAALTPRRRKVLARWMPTQRLETLIPFENPLPVLSNHCQGVLYEPRTVVILQLRYKHDNLENLPITLVARPRIATWPSMTENPVATLVKTLPADLTSLERVPFATLIPEPQYIKSSECQSTQRISASHMTADGA